ncbi:hypothetical protein PAAG_12229 [Paracoccidioides lutzii Pb01]|uniref:Uncharacterized protein n=1 Tax=Paracoccidioides lutzii (strain ATCC MYA-826 / Pb01) TaxID=502779 RepID=A0A0A2UZX2_PARBA|nr:hypothetical protein PAAG_12229 [Paracoccidioides lutzii Pb01]KGQ01101.1 hypothetical protein PAAG_12229 [Paracoccidioides lutzii Pb01]
MTRERILGIFESSHKQVVRTTFGPQRHPQSQNELISDTKGFFAMKVTKEDSIIEQSEIPDLYASVLNLSLLSLPSSPPQRGTRGFTAADQVQQKVNNCTVTSNDVTTHQSLLVHISHPSQGAKAQKEFQKA